ncbi:MAG TPA: hypothetical protein VM537_22075, partial [Anaerolineae bacterium]|nr:hypothetical protein [Anaerolineae bacterium]
PDGEDVLIRLSDHEANDARYQARINSRPDIDSDSAYLAVRALAHRLGHEPTPYLKAQATREVRRDELRKQADAESARARDRRARRDAWIEAHLPEAMKAVSREYAAKRGQQRKRFRQKGRYRQLLDAIGVLAAECTE